MENIYPVGPKSVPETLTKPSSKYKLHAWLALGGVCLFVLLYFFLTYWFGYSSIRLFRNVFSGGNNSFWNFLAAVLMAFVCLFMVKALFFIKRFEKVDDIEITEAQEPVLFQFINRIADEAGAPRPHRVFLSPRVNAAVFYDLSLINLIFPTKKNLEIGLGLVNTLNLNEFKAVLAHEFGHFAQKTMAVGRWVYISRQIAAHIIAKRDMFDSFLRGLSGFDLRIAWIGWVLSIIIWSIRALVETVFKVVILAERALSREMEFQADLVAVSLAGSDAIVNGLYRLEASDDAWDRAIRHGFEELHEGKEITDVFAVQNYFIQKIGVILDKADYGRPPILLNSTQRVFKKNLASPPKMWSTHPSGYEREENAKRIYLQVQSDERSSWILFRDPEKIKTEMSKHVFKHVPPEEGKTRLAIGTAEAIAELDRKFNKVFHDPKFRGLYLNNALFRDFRSVEDLYSYPMLATQIPALLQDLYPESLKQELELFETKKEELLMLKALRDKIWDASGGAIIHEGEEIRRKDLPEVIEKTEKEVQRLRDRLIETVKKIRTVHLKIAEQQHPSCVEYLKGLATLVHYSEHTTADMLDAKLLLNNTLNVVLADGKVSSSELTRLLKDANALYKIIAPIYTQAGNITLDSNVLKRLNTTSFEAMLEEFKLDPASEANINSWLGVVDSWINLALDRLEKLKDAALEELILTEQQLSDSFLQSQKISIPATTSGISFEYPVLLNGSERKLQDKLSLWERFYTADGLVPTLARLGVAAGIIGGAIMLGNTFHKSEVIIYNGLSIPVITTINGEEEQVNPYSTIRMNLDSPDDDMVVETKTLEGVSIEKFIPEIESESHVYVYNIAGAAAMVEWKVYYSVSALAQEPSQSNLGSSRWFVSEVDHYFEDPPETVSTSGGSATRTVLNAYSEILPANLLYFATSREDSLTIIRTHCLWDSQDAKYIIFWLTIAAEMGEEGIISERLAMHKDEVLTLRFVQDLSFKKEGKAKVHEEFQKRYDKEPENGDLYYLAARSMEDGPEQDKAFMKGVDKWPDNGWLAFAGGYAYAKQESWEKAEKILMNAAAQQPCLKQHVSLDLARVYRLNHPAASYKNVSYPLESYYLEYYQNIESGTATDSFSLAYSALSSGELEKALQLSEFNSFVRSGMIRMQAVSDDAPQTMTGKMTRLEESDGLTLPTLFSTIGFMLKQRKNITPYTEQFENYLSSDEIPAMKKFIQSIQEGASPMQSESILKDLGIRSKGYAYLIGYIFLGQKSPKEWKQKANSLLFVSERPYLKFGAGQQTNDLLP